MKHLIRLFSTSYAKGTQGYIDSQKKYEIIRTVIFFAVSISLYVAGYVTTKSNMNLLTIVAVLGCLPASKSLVSAIMFLRFKSCDKETATLINEHIADLSGLYDMIFTSQDKTYQVAHITAKGNTLCGLAYKDTFPETDFQKHLTSMLKTDGFKDVNIKIFTSREKYLSRLNQLQELECDEKNTTGILETLLSITL